LRAPFADFGAPFASGRKVDPARPAAELLVAWHAISWAEKARDYEKRLLIRFAELHDERRPFANLTGQPHRDRRCPWPR
jgi:hypothetical protein